MSGESQVLQRKRSEFRLYEVIMRHRRDEKPPPTRTLPQRSYVKYVPFVSPVQPVVGLLASTSARAKFRVYSSTYRHMAIFFWFFSQTASLDGECLCVAGAGDRPIEPMAELARNTFGMSWTFGDLHTSHHRGR